MLILEPKVQFFIRILVELDFRDLDQKTEHYGQLMELAKINKSHRTLMRTFPWWQNWVITCSAEQLEWLKLSCPEKIKVTTIAPLIYEE